MTLANPLSGKSLSKGEGVALIAILGILLAAVVALKAFAIMLLAGIVAESTTVFSGFTFAQSVGITLLSMIAFAKASFST